MFVSRNRAVAVAMAAIAASAVASSTAPASHAGPTRTDARVVRVVDGDQVVLATRAGTSTYRLLGVQAPALRDCYGREARKRLRSLLPRRARVRVVARRRGARSVVVVRRGAGVNRLVVASGHAKATMRDRSRLARTLTAAQERARDRERGLWGTCVRAGDREDDGAPVVVLPPRQDDSEGAPQAPKAPAQPGTRRGPAEFQAALENTVLSRVSASSDFGGSSNENDFTFCTAARYRFRSQSVNNGFVSSVEEAGRWRIASLSRDGAGQADSAVLELITEQSDVESFDPGAPESDRTFTVQIDAFDDGRVHVNGQPAEQSAASTCG